MENVLSGFHIIGDTWSASIYITAMLVYSVFVVFQLDIHQYQPLVINPFWISHCLSFEPLPWRPAQLHHPATLMAFSHINQLIKSKFQWWINLAQLMRCTAACCYQSTCCQVIVSCWNVRHYEVHLEAQLSYNGSNCSKSISGTGFVIYARLQKHSLSLLMPLLHMESGAIFAPSSLEMWRPLPPGAPLSERGWLGCTSLKALLCFLFFLFK